jgi:hypothetical protein
MTNVNDKLEQIVNDAMTRQLRGNDKNQPAPQFESIEHYTKMTGKRFRMTKEQKTRNMSREEAFQEFLRQGS